jgi:pimeloyl-ACP methyl ester carboxylesterase
MPLWGGIAGETSEAAAVGGALKSIANDVQTAVIPGAGHWFAEEAPEEMVAALTPFLAP